MMLLLLTVCLAYIAGAMPYNVIKTETTSSRIQLQLEYTGTDTYYGNPKNPISRHPLFILQVQTFAEFYFKFLDLERPKFEVPTGGPFPTDPHQIFTFPLSASSIDFKWR